MAVAGTLSRQWEQGARSEEQGARSKEQGARSREEGRRSAVVPARPPAPPVIDEEPRRPCPACGKLLRLGPNAAGKEVPCPGCGTILKVAVDRQQVTLKVPATSVPVPETQAASKPPVAAKPLSVITNSIGMKLVLIPAGEFMMGSPDSVREAARREKPQHRVRITQPFYLGVYPVMQAERRNYS